MLLIVSGLMFFVSCSPAKRISDGHYLYNKSKIEIEKKKIDQATLKKYQRVSTNKRILGVRFHLFLFNLASPERDGFPHSWFRKIGEAPVIYDSILIGQNSKNYTKYIADKGYNNVQVNERHVKKGKKKINVIYEFDLGEPTIINSLTYSFEDTSIRKHVYYDTAFSLIKAGGALDKPLMQAERQRIETLLKNQGYYKFSKEYIYYEVANATKENSVNVTINIKQSVSGYINPVTKIRPHKRYKIDMVNIFPNLQAGDKKRLYDTVSYSLHNILYTGDQNIKASTLADANRLLPGSLFSLNNTERTYVNYSQLGLFRFINVSFTEKESGEEYGLLNCNIELAMRKRQSYAFEVVMTNSDNDLGIRGNITYNNYNFFRGGEHLYIGLSGAIESLENRLQGSTDPMREIGITTRLETPKFLLPFSAPEFQRKYSPRTAITVSYNNQRQPYYLRTIANASFGYNWRGNMYNKHSVYPLDFYLVKIPYLDTVNYFDPVIRGTRLENSFIDHAILGTRYGFEFSNQMVENKQNFIYLRSNIESAGLLVNEINKRTNWGSDSLFFGVPYFQYIRGDIDFRQFKVLSARDRVVYRVFAGIGVPYGRSDAMPFEKMYWAGGPYGIRAWRERSLGPGSYPDTTNNQLGDIKLEANLEYRFKLFWKLEGAMFVDAGNVWMLKDDATRPGAAFHFNSFLDDIAIGTGFGARFDFSFVLIRLDFGFKLRDPSIQPDNSLPYNDEPYYLTGSKWTFRNPDVNFWDVSFQFGIGYPF